MAQHYFLVVEDAPGVVNGLVEKLLKARFAFEGAPIEFTGSSGFSLGPDEQAMLTRKNVTVHISNSTNIASDWPAQFSYGAAFLDHSVNGRDGSTEQIAADLILNQPDCRVFLMSSFPDDQVVFVRGALQRRGVDKPSLRNAFILEKSSDVIFDAIQEVVAEKRREASPVRRALRSLFRRDTPRDPA